MKFIIPGTIRIKKNSKRIFPVAVSKEFSLPKLTNNGKRKRVFFLNRQSITQNIKNHGPGQYIGPVFLSRPKAGSFRVHGIAGGLHSEVIDRGRYADFIMGRLPDVSRQRQSPDRIHNCGNLKAWIF